MSSIKDTSHGSEYAALLKRAYTASNTADTQAVYNDWAKSYNAHLLDPTINYQSPRLVAEAAVRYLPASGDLQILDAGCGTGLGGLSIIALLQKDSRHSEKSISLDGCDITPAMLNIAAETKVYRSLMQVDLTKPLSEAGVKESSYDVILCAGTLTEGHVGPSALSEFVYAAKSGGIISATVHSRVWEAGGFRTKVEKLTQDGAVEVLEDGAHAYSNETTAVTRVLVMKKKSNR